MESDARKELSTRVARETDGAARSNNAYVKGNAEFMANAGGQQQQIRREQDVVLDKMSTSLDTLKDMGQAIDAELKDQEKMCARVASVCARASLEHGETHAAPPPVTPPTCSQD